MHSGRGTLAFPASSDAPISRCKTGVSAHAAALGSHSNGVAVAGDAAAVAGQRAAYWSSLAHVFSAAYARS